MSELKTEGAAANSLRPAVDGEAEELTLVTISMVLMRKMRVIAGAAAIGFFLGAVFGLLSTREYVSRATFVPQASAEASNSGGLALAASQFGIRMPNGGGWGAPIYVEVIYSRSVLTPIALDSVTVAEEGGRQVAIADLFEIDDKAPAIRVEKAVRMLRDVITATENKKLGAVQLAVKTRWPSVSYALTQRLLADVNRFNLLTRQSQAGAERKFAETQAQEAEKALRQAEEQMRDFLEQNRVVGSPWLVNQRERIQREITIRQQAYMSLLLNVSEARLREARDTPVITVLEAPVLPAVGEPRRSAMKAVVGAIAATLLALIVILTQHARATATGTLQDFFRTIDESAPRILRRR